MNRLILIFPLILAAATARAEPTSQPAAVGRIEAKAIAESSGLVESRQYPGVYWTENDSGNPAALYAITREGKLLGTFPVRAANRDWEDLAIDDAGRIYIAETGNNDRRHAEVAVYRVAEPDPRATPMALAVERTWRLKFPAEPFDCESLFVWNGYGYLVSKHRDGTDASMYRFPLAEEKQVEPATLEKVGTLAVPFPATAADVSRDGKRLAVMTVMGPYLFRIDGDPAVACSAHAKASHFFWIDPNMEAVCFTAGGLLATNERRDVVLFREEWFEK